MGGEMPRLTTAFTQTPLHATSVAWRRWGRLTEWKSQSEWESQSGLLVARGSVMGEGHGGVRAEKEHFTLTPHTLPQPQAHRPG